MVDESGRKKIKRRRIHEGSRLGIEKKRKIEGGR
jgi:hypothetical protein